MTTRPRTSITARAGCRRQAAPALRHADPAAGQTGDGEDREAAPQVARHGRRGKDRRPVAVEGQRGDESDAVELHGRAQLDPSGHGGAVDLRPQRRARRGEEELERGQALEVYRRLGAEMVARGEHQDQVLVEQLRGHDLVAAEGERDDGEVQVPRSQLLLQLDARALGDVEVDVGMAHPQEIEELGDEPAARRPDHAETDGADDLLAQRRDVGHHCLELVHDPPGPLDHHVALFGQPARGPVDQLDVELPFQAGHVGGDVRLHRADGGRRRGEAAGVCDAQKCLQVFQFHAGLSARSACPSCVIHHYN